VPPPSRARAHPTTPQEGACMGSPPTLADDQLAAEALQLDPDHWQLGHVTAHLADQHPQVSAWPDDNPYLAHQQDHRDWGYDHPHPSRQRAAERAAEHAFDRLNPGHVTIRGGDVVARTQVQVLEDLHARGGRVRLAEALENDQPSDPDRQLVVARRVELARKRAAEQAFDRLNPEFGVPADQLSRYGQQAVRDREAAVALGPRVAVASSRENDRDPVVWLAGQDYRAADAIRRARTQPIRSRQPAERARAGAER
jgi:hypothetical protein